MHMVRGLRGSATKKLQRGTRSQLYFSNNIAILILETRMNPAAYNLAAQRKMALSN